MFSNMNLGKGMDKETQTRFRKYETIMDSMRDSELDESDVRKLYDINKMRRIARGSGSTLVCSISSTQSHGEWAAGNLLLVAGRTIIMHCMLVVVESIPRRC
jgi:hypothetical protein